MRKRLFRSLLVLLTGAPAALGQDYAPSPTYSGFRSGPAAAWPATFQTAPAVPGLVPYAPRSTPGMSWPALPSYAAPAAPVQVPQPPARSQASPVAPMVAKPQAAPAAPRTEPVLESPHEPMLSPLPADADIPAVTPKGPPPPPPAVAPLPGTPMVCEPDPEPVHGPELSHELHPPRCGPRGYRYYGSADYLFWFIRQRPSPILLSTGPLGSPGTAIILGNGNYDDQQRSGMRATIGTWLNSSQTFGLEASGLWLAQREPTFNTSAPLLARPFVDANTGAERVLILSAPGVQAGAASVSALSRLWGAQANARLEMYRSCLFHLDLLGGFRYLEVDDSLNINSVTTFGPGLLGLANTSVAESDRFGGRNTFYGGQVGMEGEFHYGRFYVDMWGKAAFGQMHEVVSINGTTLLTSASGVQTALPGGLLALPSNSGRYTHNAFAVVPEMGINFGLQLTTHLRARVGYTFLYASNIVRGGDQIDRTVNLTGRPGLFGIVVPPTGPARPAFVFHQTDFWAQGINAGLEFRF